MKQLIETNNEYNLDRNKTKKTQRTRFSYSSSIRIEDPRWYAIYTKSKFEKKLYRYLNKANYNVYLPLIKEKRRWSDRLKTVEVPLLPSYVFIKIKKKNLPQIYCYPGFVRFISFMGQPCELKEKEILFLRKLTENGFKVYKKVVCEVGDQVRIIRGPLKGWEGRVEYTSSNSRINFFFEGIQQTLSVEVPLSNVCRI